MSSLRLQELLERSVRNLLAFELRWECALSVSLKIIHLSHHGLLRFSLLSACFQSFSECSLLASLILIILNKSELVGWQQFPPVCIFSIAHYFFQYLRWRGHLPSHTIFLKCRRSSLQIELLLTRLHWGLLCLCNSCFPYRHRLAVW